MIRRMIVAMLLAVTAILFLAPAAVAGRATGAVAPAVQASSSPETCQVGEVCQGITNGDFSNAKLPPGSDPPGAMTRSLIMLGLFAAGFVVYLRWALQKKSTPA